MLRIEIKQLPTSAAAEHRKETASGFIHGKHCCIINVRVLRPALQRLHSPHLQDTHTQYLLELIYLISFFLFTEDVIWQRDLFHCLTPEVFIIFLYRHTCCRVSNIIHSGPDFLHQENGKSRWSFSFSLKYAYVMS